MTVPERIGRYDVVERIGSGGFATVWRGYDRELTDDVAIKVLAAHWNEHAGLRERFIEEARVMRQADSDHIVRVYDIGALDDGRPYFVMSYADHGTLVERMTGLPPGPALRIATETARAVGYLHDLGFAHRDIKPSNVLFRSTPVGEQLMIADLGLARAIAEGASTTIVAGTPGYMAPEQAFANAAPDQRTDVYALGALTYHLLTGQTPAPPTGGPPTPPSAFRPELPPGADPTVLRALAPDRDARWPTATALADALQALPAPPTPAHVPAPQHEPKSGTGANVPAPANGGAHPERPSALAPTAADTPPPTATDEGCTAEVPTQGPEPPWNRDAPTAPEPRTRSKRRLGVGAAFAGGVALVLVASVIAYIGQPGTQAGRTWATLSLQGITVKVPSEWKQEDTAYQDGFNSFEAKWEQVSPYTHPQVPVLDEPQPSAAVLTTQPTEGSWRTGRKPVLDARPGITIMATHVPKGYDTVFDAEYAPEYLWQPQECIDFTAGYIHAAHPDGAKPDLRTWKTEGCAAGDWYAHAVIHGDDYDVNVFMVAEPGDDVFTKVARSIEINAKDLPTYIPP